MSPQGSPTVEQRLVDFTIDTADAVVPRVGPGIPRPPRCARPPATCARTGAGDLLEVMRDPRCPGPCRSDVLATTLGAARALGDDDRTDIAAVIGVEVAVRLVGATRDDRPAGIDLVRTAGLIGAGLAAARAAGLDHAGTSRALAMTTSQAVAVAGDVPWPARRHLAGAAASIAVEVALAAPGLAVAPTDPISGVRGLQDVLRLHLDGEVLLGGLGTDWRCRGPAVDGVLGACSCDTGPWEVAGW